MHQYIVILTAILFFRIVCDRHSRIHPRVFQKTEILDVNVKYPSELKSSSTVKSHSVNFHLFRVKFK